MRWLKYFESYTKNKWELLLSNEDKKVEGHNLIKLVNNAYNNNDSFIKTMRDVIKSYWYIIDLNENEGINACIFYRTQRKNETWVGKKIQGIGHDGSYESKKAIIDKLLELLEQDGIWIEASGKLEDILINKKANRITNITTIENIFKESTIKMLKNGQYERNLNNGKIVKESTFGFPKFN